MLSVSDPVPAPRCPADFNLVAHVLRAAGHVPDKVALRIVSATDHEDWTYARLAGGVRRISAGIGRVTEPGSYVLLRLGNSARFPLAFLGAIHAGAIPVVTSAQLTVPEITAIAAGLRPALILADDGVALPRAIPDRPAIPVIGPDVTTAWLSLAPADLAPTRADDPAYVICTSGTSGRPRGVLHAHRAIWARGMMRDGWQGLGPDDRLMHAGAFNWSYTLGVGLLDVWAAGATAVVPDGSVAAEAFPQLMRQHGVTILAAVPGIYRRLLRLPDLSVPTLRHGLSAGEALPPATRRAWRQATGTDLHEALGLTECSTFISGSPRRPAPEGCCGFAQDGRRIAVVDDNGQPVPRGTAGLLAIACGDPGLFLRYLDASDPPESAHPGAWFLTGDSAVMEPSGALRYLGRADDMMNAGGFRVSPVEIETALEAHPRVTESAAFELFLRHDTSVIAAAYVGTAEPETLRAYAESRLAPYKRPRIYRRVDALPRSANGKINRRALREEWTAEQ